MKTPNWAALWDNWPAKVLAFAAALLLFLFNRFDSLEVRSYTVPLRMVTDVSLMPAQEYSHRVKVTLRGAADILSQVTDADLEAVADFSGRQGEGVFSTAVQINRTGVAGETAALEVSVEPMSVSLHLEKKVVRTVAVKPDFSGAPGRDFELSGFQVTPSTVTVEGPRSLVEGLSVVATEPIELRGKTDTFTLKARLSPGSDLISFPYGSTVEVLGMMTSSLSSLVLDNLAPSAVNLTSSLKLQSPLPVVRVRLRGTAQALALLPKDDRGSPTVAVVADLGAYTVPGELPGVELKAILPEGVELVELSPAVVPLVLEARP